MLKEYAHKKERAMRSEIENTVIENAQSGKIPRSVSSKIFGYCHLSHFLSLRVNSFSTKWNFFDRFEHQLNCESKRMGLIFVFFCFRILFCVCMCECLTACQIAVGMQKYRCVQMNVSFRGKTACE